MASKWSNVELGHLRMILESYQSHSIHEMAKLARNKLKKRTMPAIIHKLNELITEREFKGDSLELKGVIYPAEVVSGYVVIRLPDGSKQPAHIFTWEQEHGLVPKGYHIHHLNGNRADNRLINLQAMSSVDHIRIHMSGAPPETAALFWYLQEKSLWKDYLTYRAKLFELILGEEAD